MVDSDNTQAKKLTTPDKEYHKGVLIAAQLNLDLVIDEVESLDHGLYDELLESLDVAKIDLKKLLK